jgi:hypothetical protein
MAARYSMNSGRTCSRGSSGVSPGVATAAAETTRSGSSDAQASAKVPPIDMPSTPKRLMPSESASSAASSTIRWYDAGAGVEAPYPGRLAATRRTPAARAAAYPLHAARRVSGQP